MRFSILLRCWLTIAFACLIAFDLGWSMKIRDRIIEKLLKLNYNKNERPTEATNRATDVMVYSKILAINKVDVINMEYTVDMLLRQEWSDPRLNWIQFDEFKEYNINIVSPMFMESIWLPDLFFRNGKEGRVHKMTTPNFLLRVTPNGTVLYSQKVTIRFSCQMDLATFPMDTQTCGMNIGSYGYTIDEVDFFWKPISPITLDQDMLISEFETPKSATVSSCSEGYKTSTGNFSCLECEFILHRQLGSYLSTTYIPNILIVMVSWLNFWVNVDAVPARVPLGLLTLLGILTQANSIASNLPRVTYMKAIDIWIIACLCFVICVLLEFAIASSLARRKKQVDWQKEIKKVVREELTHWSQAYQYSGQNNKLESGEQWKGALSTPIEFSEELESLLVQFASSDKAVKTKQPSSPRSDVDDYSKFIFPISYCLFNCFYWFYYLKIVKSTTED